ncbi:MAG: hypothetical protein Q4G00_16120 [Clostridia bacterium]|nr:hypothetical protein [Clostridia bacterium]
MLITAVDGKDVTTGQPQSSWFRLTDLLPKAGFRDWVLNPANGYVDVSGNLLISGADELAEAYKVYERLGLNASVSKVDGAAGNIASGLIVSIVSDETMVSGGTIAIYLSDATEGLSDTDRIAFDAGMAANTQSGTAVVENGVITVTLSEGVVAGTNVEVTVDVPLSYAAKLGEHDVAAFAQYSQDGAILKQTQHPGQGTITVTAPAGWHLVAADGPDSAVTPGEYVSYTLVARNFEASEVVLTGWSARYNDTDFEIAAVKVGDTVFNKNESGSYADASGNALTAITVPGASVDAVDPSATVAGETIITLRVKAPSEPVSKTTVTSRIPARPPC